MMQHNFIQYGVVAVAFVTFAIFASSSAGRNIRPSEHGLAYQVDASSPAPNSDAQEMRSFFGSTTSSVPLPEAQSIGNETWWRAHDGDGRSGDNRRDNVRVGLLVAAAICGFAGVVLLLVSGIVFVVRRRKQTAEAVRLSSNSELHAVNDK